ncbi:MAG: hypothetical protein ACRD5B_14575 [Nitrososphaeraceae archaeon]
MSNIYIESFTNKHYSLPQRIGPGSLPNDKVPMCRICASQGFPHESVVSRKMSDGIRRILNYNNGKVHQHRPTEEELWEVLWN